MGDHIKKASIVSIGNEVVGGRTVDTNAAHISRQLLAAGVPVVGTYAVRDAEEAIARAFRLAAQEADVVVSTGGLGPTDDDVTRQGLADFLGVELELRQELLTRLTGFFERRGIQMVAKNRVQACIPKGAEVIPNDLGTAAGIAAQKDHVLLFALPGVPREMECMLTGAVLPRLRALSEGQAIAVERLRCFGVGESTLAEMVGGAMQRGRNPLVNCTVSAAAITLEVVATAQTHDEAEMMAEKEAARLKRKLGKVVYGVNDDTLAKVVGRSLAQAGQTLATAESCTGGLLAKLVTDVPGASRYFYRGWITYSDQAKRDELGVSESLLAEHGAVSEQVAGAMAQGARRAARADYAIGITGIAGPDGGSEQKPVGLVYISVDHKGGTSTSRYMFSQDRPAVRMRAAQTALNMLRGILES